MAGKKKPCEHKWVKGKRGIRGLRWFCADCGLQVWPKKAGN